MYAWLQASTANYALLGYYSASSRNFLPRRRNYHYSLRNNPEERSSLILVYAFYYSQACYTLLSCHPLYLRHVCWRVNLLKTKSRLLNLKTKSVPRSKHFSVHLPPCTRNNVHKYSICCHNNIITKNSYFKHVILARKYMCSVMMISDMLSKHVGAVKSVLKKWFKINYIQLVHLLVVW